MAAREEAEIERDRALELTLEVLKRRQADKRRGVDRTQSAPGVAPSYVRKINRSLALLWVGWRVLLGVVLFLPVVCFAFILAKA